LSLEPSERGTDVLSCSFLDVALSTNPEFEILSGFWGHQQSPFSPVSLLVDGQSCKTTSELAQALFRFRFRDKPRLLWIQSVSINIDDTSERNAQIGRLRDILLSAQRLIVWLGAAQDNSDLVFEHLRRFEHLRSEYERPWVWPQDSFSFRVVPFKRPSTPPDRVEEYSPDARAALWKLCARPWFYRPWSIAELALSKDILVVCGDHEVRQLVYHISPLSWLLQACPRVQAVSSKGVSLYDDLKIPMVDAGYHFFSLCFHYRLPGRTPSMADVYRIVRNCRATDPRDSVFATAALEPIPPVEVNYQLSVSQVYQQATFALMQKHRSIQVLRRLGSPSRNPDLPSWTLDFNSPLDTAGAIWALPGPRFRGDQPSRNHEEVDAERRGLWPFDSQVPRPRHERQTNTLVLAGILMETISAIGPVMPASVAIEATTTTTSTPQTSDSSPASASHHQQFTQILHAWETLATTHLHPPSNRRFPQPLSDAFLDTLIAHDAHDVLGNDPPRPTISSEADWGRTWYAQHGTGVLRTAEPEYFALRDRSDDDGGGGSGGESGGGVGGRCVPGYCLPAGPWALAGSRARDEYCSWRDSVDEGAFGRRVARACAGKRFYVTDQGRMGLAPMEAREGDVVVFFPTGKFPMFLQPLAGDEGRGGGRRYRFLGEGFLYDWWRHVLPVFEHRIERGLYSHLLTEFAIQ
jgi:hypothetical protein